MFLTALVATSTVAGQPPGPLKPASAPPTIVTPKPPWGRIVMVGASATAGFTESEPLGGPVTRDHRLNRYVDAALLVPHEPVQNLASALFFVQAEAIGRAQMEQALKARPTLVIAADFLFWFCYGEGPTDKDRLQRFETGLKLLEAVPCPLIVGDVPDASGASDSILAPEQIPSTKAMLAANRRLKEWAASRPHAVVLSLSGFMRAATANHKLTIRNHVVPEGRTRGLLQDDRLHPGPSGCAVLAVAILDAFQSTRPASTTNEIRWNPSEVFRFVFKPRERSPNVPSKQVIPPVPARK